MFVDWKRVRKSSALLVAVCAVLLASSSLAEKKESKSKDPAKKDSSKKSGKRAKPADGEKPADENEGTRKAFDMIPKDHDAKGLKIPYFDGTGKLQMIYTIGVASRLDEGHLKMSDMQVETFDSDGEHEMLIDLPSSVLDVNTSVISTKKHVTIRREDFEMTGETMEFNTKTKQGTLGGNVRMLIYDLKNETAPPEKTAPPASETEAAPSPERKSP